MNSHPFITAAENWIQYLSKRRKLTKHEKRAVLAFGGWLDTFIQKQEMEEQMKEAQQYGKEN